MFIIPDSTVAIPKSVVRILTKLKSSGYSAYLVGGCVRDYFLNIVPKDWDICTSAVPDEVEPCLSEDYVVVPTGVRFGTVTVFDDSNNGYEVTTFRTESEYSDNRHPDIVEFSKYLVEDLSRRDFTINAMALDVDSEGNIQSFIDPFDGKRDLERKVIRCVGSPYDRFHEDALRILRALRFSSRLGFDIDIKTKIDIIGCCSLLNKISSERINKELREILTNNCFHVLSSYRDVFVTIIPELKFSIGFNQQNKYHCFSVYEHLINSVHYADKSFDIRMTMLLHDIGKPFCFQLDSNYVGHFKGHEDVSAGMAYDILKRLRFDNELIDTVVTLIKYHDYTINPRKKSVLRLLNKLGSEELFLKLLKVKEADIMAQSDYKKLERLQELEEVRSIYNSIVEENAVFSIRQLAVSGDDLIACGLKEGVIIGKYLRKALDAVINSEIPNERDAILNYLFLQKDGGCGV